MWTQDAYLRRTHYHFDPAAAAGACAGPAPDLDLDDDDDVGPHGSAAPAAPVSGCQAGVMARAGAGAGARAVASLPPPALPLFQPGLHRTRCVCVCLSLSLSLSLSLFLSLCLSARSPAAGPGRGSRGASTQNCRVGVEVGHRTKRRHCRCSRSRSRHRCIERSCVVCSFRRRADGSRRCRCRYGVRLFCLPRSALNCVTSRRVFPRCAVAEADARNAAAVERAKSQAKIMEEQLQFATTRADDSAEDAREAHTQLTAATTQIKTLQVRRCRLVWET